MLVVEDGGALIGYVELCRPALASAAHVHTICGLGVDPARQRQGVGRLLVDAAVAECARRGAQKVKLRVLAHNAEALRLYARCGFVQEGVFVGEFWLDGEFVDDLLLARWL